MKMLLPLIQQAALSGLACRSASLMSMNKFGLGLVALSGFVFLMALIFLVLSGYGWLLTHYEQPVAALIVSAYSLSISLVFCLGGVLIVKRKSIRQRQQITKLMSEISDAVNEQFSEPIKDNPKTAVVMASVAGLIAGERLH